MVEPGSRHVAGHGPGLRDTVPGQDLLHVTGAITRSSSDMEELAKPGSTEASTGRGQETGLPPAACTGAGVGEHLGGGLVVAVRDTAGGQEHLESA